MTFSFTPEIEKEILERLADGESLNQICRDKHMPSRWTVMRRCESDTEFATKCACAREFQGDWSFDRQQEVMDKVERGELTPDIGRVLLSGYQWRAAKLRPKKYGDQTRIDLKAEVTIEKLTDEQLNSELTRLAAEAGVTLAAGGEGETEA